MQHYDALHNKRTDLINKLKNLEMKIEQNEKNQEDDLKAKIEQNEKIQEDILNIKLQLEQIDSELTAAFIIEDFTNDIIAFKGLKQLHNLNNTIRYIYKDILYPTKPATRQQCKTSGEFNMIKNNFLTSLFYSKDRKFIADNIDVVMNINESTRSYINYFTNKQSNIILDDHLYKNYENIRKIFLKKNSVMDLSFTDFQQNSINNIQLFDVGLNAVFVYVCSENIKSNLYMNNVINNLLDSTTQEVLGEELPYVVDYFEIKNQKILLTNISITTLPIILKLMENNQIFTSFSFYLCKAIEIKTFQPFKVHFDEYNYLLIEKGFFVINPVINDLYIMKKFIMLNLIEDKENLDKLNKILLDKDIDYFTKARIEFI
jgi:hypothetical protein